MEKYTNCQYGQQPSPTTDVQKNQQYPANIRESLLLSSVVPDVKTKIEHKRRLIKQPHYKRAFNLPQLEIGQPIYVKSKAGQEYKWEKAICKDKLSDMSYIVDVNGESYRRNRTHLKKSNGPVQNSQAKSPTKKMKRLRKV